MHNTNLNDDDHHHHHGVRETLLGHVLFGLIFIISGFVATIAISWRFMDSRLRGGYVFKNS